MFFCTLRLLSAALALLLLSSSASGGAHAGASERTDVDDRGKAVTLAQPAQRVVALAPNLAELVADAGAGAALVGVVRGSDYPSSLSRLPLVGDAAGIDIERVFALRPDLILAWRSGNRAGDIATLEQLGMRVFVVEPDDLVSVGRLLRRLGALLGTAKAANRVAADYEAKLAALTQAKGASAPVSAFVQIWDAPLMTVNGKHLISDVLARCGARNVFDDLPVLAGSVSIEAVLARDPALIIAALPPGRQPERQWARWQRLQAVRSGRIYAIDPDLLARSTPRILLGLQQVCMWVAQARNQLRPAQ
ncbi:MAG TPA: cobalamin-binding protein [Burkholderiales bacterium]|nr:cobalamin-binding protein [Burkholderiales bacterium]